LAGAHEFSAVKKKGLLYRFKWNGDNQLDLLLSRKFVKGTISHPNTEVEEPKALLAAKIIGVLDDHALTVRIAEGQIGIAIVAFSRIRKK
jgi:hypothetical protein